MPSPAKYARALMAAFDFQIPGLPPDKVESSLEDSIKYINKTVKAHNSTLKASKKV